MAVRGKPDLLAQFFADRDEFHSLGGERLSNLDVMKLYFFGKRILSSVIIDYDTGMNKFDVLGYLSEKFGTDAEMCGHLGGSTFKNIVESSRILESANQKIVFHKGTSLEEMPSRIQEGDKVVVVPVDGQVTLVGRGSNKKPETISERDTERLLEHCIILENHIYTASQPSDFPVRGSFALEETEEDFRSVRIPRKYLRTVGDLKIKFVLWFKIKMGSRNTMATWQNAGNVVEETLASPLTNNFKTSPSNVEISGLLIVEENLNNAIPNWFKPRCKVMLKIEA